MAGRKNCASGVGRLHCSQMSEGTRLSMNDETVEIPAAQQETFKTEVQAAYKEHEEESRRSLGISTGFYEKLSVLDAGSIAVSASIGIALIAKPQLQSSSLHAATRWLAVITISLWLSLVCAVLHNFVAVAIAKLESAYSHVELVRTIIRRGLATLNTNPALIQPLGQVGAAAQEEPILQQQQIMKRRLFLNPCLTALGYASMGSFVAAYTLVMVCVVRLWWIAR
jgi:hypothetical protein